MSKLRVTLAAILFVPAMAIAAGAQSTNFGADAPERRYFRVEASVVAGRGGPEIEGHVYNVYHVHAMRVRLRVESLDAAGGQLEARVVYVLGDVPPNNRTYFRATLPAGATSVRAAVIYFDWVSRFGGM